MFIGHFALGLAAKRAAPRVSLGVLFAAAQLADLLWPFFLAVGLEQVRIDPGNTALTPLDFVSYPYSHSLLLLVVWGVAMAFVCSPFARGPPSGRRHQRAGRQPLGPRLRHPSTRHAAVSGRAEARARALELDPRDRGRRSPDVRRWPLDLLPHHAPARRRRPLGVRRARRDLAAGLRRPTSSARRRPRFRRSGCSRSSAASSSRRGAAGRTAIAMLSSSRSGLRRQPDCHGALGRCPTPRAKRAHPRQCYDSRRHD